MLHVEEIGIKIYEFRLEISLNTRNAIRKVWVCGTDFLQNCIGSRN
jgi:hypothetical protein